MVLVSYLAHYDTLWQNATDIITKCDESLLENCIRLFITKCHSFIESCNSYCKMCLFYYKMRQLLQLPRLLQNDSVQ